MFVKLTKSGPRRYLQLAESYRDKDGYVKQRTVASLGRLEKIDAHFDSIMRGLERVTGRNFSGNNRNSCEKDGNPTIRFEHSRSFGDTWALTQLWDELGFHQLAKTFSKSRQKLDVEGTLKVMVFNRICNPLPKFGVMHWLESACLPGIELNDITHQSLLLSIDALMDKRHKVNEVVTSLLHPYIDHELSVLLYDLTTTDAEWQSQLEDNAPNHRLFRDSDIEQIFALGVVQTAEGLPVYHEVFNCDIAETSKLETTLKFFMQRFKIRRVIAVADRDFLSIDNLNKLKALRTPTGEQLEFILAVPDCRYDDFQELLLPVHKQQCLQAKNEVINEATWENLRLVVSHDPLAACEQTAARNLKIKQLKDVATQWFGKNGEQSGGKHFPDRKLSDGSVQARFYQEVVEAKLARIINVDVKTKSFNYSIDQTARRRAEMMDGKLLLISNTKDLSPQEIVTRYKSLTDIKRGFRVLESELKIVPVFHRLADRIRVHALVSFMAMVIHRVMRQRLEKSQSLLSPEQALESLRRIQRHRITFNDRNHSGVSNLSNEQGGLLNSLNIAKPT